MAEERDSVQFLDKLGIRRLTGADEERARERIDRWLEQSGRQRLDQTAALLRQYEADMIGDLLGQADQYDDLIHVAMSLASASPDTTVRVLDIGGGPGVLAGWITSCWPGSTVTVIDPAAPDPLPWLTPLQGVRFIREAWPSEAAIRGLGTERFDCAFLGRLGRSAHLREGATRDAAFRLFADLAAPLPRVLIPSGLVLVIDYPSYLQSFQTAMEQLGFSIEQHTLNVLVMSMPRNSK